jgi:alginate O-acetyltransferase complex protein AlgI
MIFNSIEFVIFFIVVTALFYAIKHKYRWALLLIASCYFYMFFKPIYILILFLTIVIDYFAAIYIDKHKGSKRKLFLVLSIIANVGVLAIFKYYNFFIENVNGLLSVTNSDMKFSYLDILLPIGLSFHTFQAMSYTIEVYRGNYKPERHFGIYSLYVMFYPQLVAGPIERPQQILPQFHIKREFNYTNISDGLKLMLWGMFKKVVIADRLAVFVNQVYNNHTDYQGLSLCIAAVFFSFQIYFDFSGYSDIAVGSAKVMGYDLMQNFNRPYAAKSISEFWKRWHISLSSWFKDYVYIPLGGSRVKLSRWIINILIVFMISGLWHGASWTFIVWGALHGLYNVAEIFIKKLNVPSFSRTSIHKQIILFCLVTFAWIFFRAENFDKAFYIIKNMFSGLSGQLQAILQNKNFERLHLIYLEQTGAQFFLSIFLLLFVGSIEYLQFSRSIPEFFNSFKPVFRWSFYFLIFYSIILLGVFDNTQFIYFQF